MIEDLECPVRNRGSATGLYRASQRASVFLGHIARRTRDNQTSISTYNDRTMHFRLRGAEDTACVVVMRAICATTDEFYSSVRGVKHAPRTLSEPRLSTVAERPNLVTINAVEGGGGKKKCKTAMPMYSRRRGMQREGISTWLCMNE